MMYHVEFSKEALKQMKKLDKHIALFITAWIRKNLEGCIDPFIYGKGLSANHIGRWRYRIGKYRLITEIMEEKVIILIVTVGHRWLLGKICG
ncbi:MAG: type II toxin-antitoxin system RelE/ParE family toxin [Spirochaetia bacterium]|nr:type II toxin-antitoxin system RelE/ParE family toxin [Spirochaetia bacterium]